MLGGELRHDGKDGGADLRQFGFDMGHTFNLSDNNANGVAGSVRTRATWINLAMTTLPADTVHATISELVRAYLAPDYRWQHDGAWHEQIGRAHVCTPATNAHLVRRPL